MEINRFDTGICPYFSIVFCQNRCIVLFKQENSSNSFQAMYRFLQYFASIVFPVVFIHHCRIFAQSFLFYPSVSFCPVCMVFSRKGSEEDERCKKICRTSVSK